MEFHSVTGKSLKTGMLSLILHLCTQNTKKRAVYYDGTGLFLNAKEGKKPFMIQLNI